MVVLLLTVRIALRSGFLSLNGNSSSFQSVQVTGICVAVAKE